MHASNMDQIEQISQIFWAFSSQKEPSLLFLENPPSVSILNLIGEYGLALK